MDNRNYYQNPQLNFSSEEIESNVPKKSNDGNGEKQRSFGYKILNFVAITFGVISLTLLMDLQSKPPNSSTTKTNFLKSFSEPDFNDGSGIFSASISVSSPIYGSLQSLAYLPWAYIAEPYRDQLIEISSFKLDETTYNISEGKYDIKWNIANEEYKGKQATFRIESTGSIDCTVTISVLGSDGMTAITSHLHHFTIMVKYVRREIRSLTSEDRTAFFRALERIYTVKKLEGKKLYGPNFRSSEELLVKHLNGAGTSDCDHWHDGPAILTHHVGFTLELEQALQSIDKTLSVPYWEYGMDKYLYPETFTVSPVFDPAWFGEASPTNADHKINDKSFWADVEFPSGEPYSKWDIKASRSLNPFVNSFGFLRSPWNNNPINGICRSNTTYGYSMAKSLPSCDVFKACFQSTTLAETNYYLNGVTHGPVHIMIGGAWKEDSIFKRMTSLDFLLKGPMKVLIFKVLWRMGYTRCPVACPDKDSCKCSIPNEYLAKYGAKAIAVSTNISSFLSDYVDMTNETVVLDVLRAVEDPGVVGDMLTSSAAYDPTFWPLHGSAERLMAYKRALMSQKVEVVSSWDDSWGYPSASIRDIYLYGVCDWSAVTGPDDLTLPSCDMRERCPGHNENDKLEFENFLNRNETYTNRDMWEFMHPWNNELPYVYDTFDYQYCTDQGYDFLDYSTNSPSSSATEQPTMPQLPATEQPTMSQSPGSSEE